MKDLKSRGKKGKSRFEPSRKRDHEERRKPIDGRFGERRPAPAERARPDRAPETKPKTADSRLIYGVSPVLESLRAHSRRLEKILIAEGAREHRIAEIIDLARENHVPFQKVARENLVKLVEPGTNHQGVIALTASADYEDAESLLEEVAGKPDPFVLVLDGVEDPRNLGAILRVAECAGVDGTFIPEHRAVGLTETVVKTSAGATEHTKIAKVKNLNRLIEELKSNNIWVIGTAGEAATDYTEWDWTRPSALVLGGEGKGLHRLVAENCDALVRIPMRGKIESLNVSVAAGVILFEAVRQRNAQGRKESEKAEE